MLTSFTFKSLNAGAVLSTDLLKGPALAVRGTTSSKSTVLASNFTVIEFIVQVLWIAPCLPPPPPPSLKRPLQCLVSATLQCSPPYVLLRYHGLYITACAMPPWTGGRENCSEWKGLLFPAASACFGVGFHLGDIMKEILQQKQFLHPSIGSVLSIPSLCRRQTSSLAAVFHMIAFLQGTACFG